MKPFLFPLNETFLFSDIKEVLLFAEAVGKEALKFRNMFQKIIIRCI
jgi:hypothetical protein